MKVTAGLAESNSNISPGFCPRYLRCYCQKRRSVPAGRPHSLYWERVFALSLHRETIDTRYLMCRTMCTRSSLFECLTIPYFVFHVSSQKRPEKEVEFGNIHSNSY